MNQPRTQRYTLILLALIGLVLGSNLGAFFDQANGATMSPAVVLAYRACPTCLDTTLAFAAEALNVNRWLLAGAFVGLLLGALAGWVLRLLRPAGPATARRVSSFRQSAEVARFSQDVGATLEMQDILEQLHDEVMRVTSADCGSSLLFDLNSPEHRVSLRVGEAADVHRLNPMEAAAVATAASRVVQDFEAEKEAPPHVGIRSALLVPITHAENTIGLIHLHSQEPARFDAEFHDLVQALAAQAAVAVLNAQRFDEQSRRTEALRQRVNQLQQLVQSPSLVRADRALPDNLDAIAGALQELAEFRLVVLSAYAASANQLRHIAARGSVPAAFNREQQAPVPWDRLQPFLREEYRSGRAYLLPHAQTPDLLQALELGRPPARTEPRVTGQWHADDAVLMPLYASRGGDILGLLVLGAPRDPATPQNLVLELAEFFAGQAALALENAQLLADAEARVDEAQERSAQLNALTEAAGLIGAALRVDEVVTLMLDQLRRVIAYDAVTFWRRGAAGGQWHAAGSRSYQEALERVVERMEHVKGVLFSEITTTRSVLFISDVTRDVRFQMRGADGLRSWLGVPLLSQGEVIGLLSLEKGEDNFYSASHVPLALSFAGRAAVALENARQYEESVARARELEDENARRLRELETRTQRLALLNRIAGELNAAADLDSLLALTLRALTEPLLITHASALVFDPDGPRDAAFIMAAARVPAGGPQQPPLALADNSLLERLETNALPVVVEPDRPAPDSPVRPEHLAWVGPEVQAAVFLPLLAQSRLVGVIGLGSAARRLASADVELGFAVAQLAVTAIQNVQLRHKTREQALASQLARGLSRAASLPALWDSVHAQLGALVGARTFSLALYDETRNEVAFPLIVENGERLDGAAAAASGQAPSGLVRHLLGTRQPLLLSGDHEQYAGLLAVPGQHPVRGRWEGAAPRLARAYLGVPLELGDRLLGVLIAEDPERDDAFNDSHERLLSAVASQIAVTVDNLRLYGQAQAAAAASHERAAQLEALADVSLALASTLRTEEVIRRGLDQLQRVLPHAAVTYWHKVSGTGQGQTAARWRAAEARGYANTAERLGQTIELEPGTALAEVAAGRGVLALANMAEDARFAAGSPARAWLGLRVINQGVTIGLLELEASGPAAYTPGHGAQAQAFAARLALALNEARQYEESLARAQELDTQARRLTLLYRAAVELGGSLEPGRLLSAALRLMAEATGLRRGGAVVYEEGRATALAAASLPPQPEAGDARGLARTLAGNPLLARLRGLAAIEAIDDLSAEQALLPEHTAWMGGGAQSLTFLPLSVDGQTLGWVGLGQRAAHKPLAPAELELAQSIAGLAATAVHEALLYHRSQQRLDEQAAINQISRAISQPLELAHLAEVLRAQLDAWLEPRHLYLGLYDEARNELADLVVVEHGQAQPPRAQTPGGLLRRVLSTEQPLLLAGDVPAQLRELGLPPEALAPQRQYLAAPLRLGERTLGVLALADPRRAEALNESHARILVAVAAQAAIAVENARQYADTLRRVSELEAEAAARGQQLAETTTVQQFSRGLSRSLDAKTVWDSLRLQLDAWLAPRSVTVALYDETRHELSFPLAIEGGQPLTLSPRAPAGVLRHLLQTQEPLLLSGDVAAQLRALDLPADSAGTAASYLAVPVRAADRLLGVVTVADPADGSALSPTHARLLQALADQLAPVVDNARQHSQARQAVLAAQARAGQMALVAEAGEAIFAAHRPDEVVAQALGQLHRLLPYARATYWRALPADNPAVEEARLQWQAVATRGSEDGPAPLPDSLADELASTREPLLTAGAGRAWLGLPLVSQEAVMGALVAESAAGHAFEAADLPALERFARAAAVGVEAARRYDDSLRHARDLEARAGLLEHLGIELNAALELDKLLPVQLRVLAMALNADTAGVLVFTDQAGAPGLSRVLASARYPLTDAALPAAGAQGVSAAMLAGNLLVEWATHAEAPMAVNDLTANRLVAPEQVAWVGEGLRAALFLPLVDDGRALGLVGLGYQTARGPITAAETDLGRALAAQAAPVVKNALAYEAARRQIEEHNVLQQVLRLVSRAGDVWQLGEAIHSRLAAWLGADSLYLALYDAEQDLASFPVVVDGGALREVPPLTPGGVLRHVLLNRHALRLSGDPTPQARELGIALAGVPPRPLRWSSEAGELLTAQSFLGVPILSGENVVGALALESANVIEAFDARHERILATIAAQVGVMLENTRAYRETREALAAAQGRVSQLETLTVALGEIATVLYSDDVVGVALAQFQRVLPADQIVYWQREPSAGRELRWRLAGALVPERAPSGGAPDAARQALFAELVSARRPLVVPDTSRDARFGGGPAAGQAWLAVPLLSQGEVMGILALEHDTPNTYHTGHAPAAQVLANQVAAVLTNAAEYEQSLQRVLELDERGRRLAFLNRFAAEVGSGLDMRGALQVTLQALAQTLGLEQATAAVFDETQTTVLAIEHYPEASGTQALLAGFSLSGSFLRDRLQDARAPIAIEDVTALEPSSRLRQADWIGRDVKSAMFLPLTHGSRLVGVVGLGQSAPGRRFTANEMDLAMALANQAAVAVQNAVLFEKTQQRLAEQATVNQVNRALGRALDLNQLFAVVRAQLQDWVGPEHLYLGIYDAQRNEVSFPLAVAAGQPVSLSPRAPAGLARHLLQTQQPVRLNGEVTQQLKDLGLFVSGLGPSVGLDDLATVKACLAVPLAAADKAVGLLLLANPTRTEAFDESHERILAALAPQIAVSLETTLQYDQAHRASAAAQARTAQLTALTEATSTVASALRSEQVIAVTLDQLQRVLPYDRVTFWRRVGGNGLWQVAAARAAAGPHGYVEAPERLGQTSELDAPQHDPLAEVFATRSLMAVPDTSQDPRFGGNGGAAGSWLGLPLIHKGEVQALLALEKAEANAYGAGLIPLAQVFANQAAVALANVSLYEASVQRAFELDERAALINRVSEALSASVDPDEVVGIALTAMAEAVPLDLATIIVFDETRPSGRARATAHYPPARPAPAGGLPLTSNLLLNQLRETLRPVVVQSVASETLLQADHYEWVGPGLQAALFVPLVMARSVIGVIGLGQVEAARGFTSAEVNLAQTLANQAAIAVHHARLYRQTQRRLMELAHISQAGRAIGQTVDVRQLYDTVRHQVEAGLRADSQYLALYDATRDEVSFPVLVIEGKAVQIPPQKPDPLLRHILNTGEALLLTGGVEQKLAELGLWPAGATTPPPTTLPLQAKAYLGVPLLLGQRVAGVLAVQDFKRAFGLSEKHERILAGIAAPIAPAVDGARMYAESAQRALALDARSALLGRMAAELGDLVDLPRALAFIAQVLTETLVAEVGAAIVFDDASDSLHALAAARYPDPGEGIATNFLTDSLVGQQVLSSQAPLTLDELAVNDEQRRGFTAWLADGVQSALFLPLLTGDRLVGLAVVASRQAARQFTPGEVELAQALANQAAIAVANVRQQEAMQPRLLALTTIGRVSQALREAPSLPQIADALLKHLGAALEAETLYLALYDQPRHEVSFPLLSAAGTATAVAPQAPAGQLAYLLAGRQSLLLSGAVSEQLQRLGSSYAPVHPTLAAPQSLLGVSLIVNDRLVGALVAEDHNQPGRFNPTHESILLTLSGPLAAALDNLRLQAETSQRAHELATRAEQLAVLNRASAALIGAPQAAAILAVAARELGAALGAEFAGAFALAADGSTVMTGPPAPEAPAPVPDALLRQLRQEGGTVVIAAPSPEQTGWLAPGLKSALCVPLRREAEFIGALVVAQQSAARAYSAQEVALAELLGNQTALALENARHMQAWQQTQASAHQSAAQFTALAAAAQQITAAPRTDDVVRLALEQARHLLAAASADFWRLEPASGSEPGQLRRLAPAADAPDTLPLDRAGRLAEVAGSRAPISHAAGDAGPAWLGLPLLHRGEVLGVLALTASEGGAFGSDAEALGQALAGFVAGAYANARQYEYTLDQSHNLDQEARRLALLQRVQRDVFRTLDVRAVLERLAREAAEVTAADQATVWLAGAESGAGGWLGHYPAAAQRPPPAPANPLLERLAAAGGPLLVADAAAENVAAEHTAWMGPGARSLLLVPLALEAQPLGVLAVARVVPGGFSERDAALAHDLARATAAGLQHATRQAQLEADLRDQSALSALEEALRAATAEDQVAAALLAWAQRALNAATVCLAVLDQDGQHLRFPVLMEAGQPRVANAQAPAGVLQHILRTNAPLQLAGDTARELKALGLPHKTRGGEREPGQPASGAAYLGVPLRQGDAATGVLAVERANAAAFSDTDAHRLAAAAAQAHFTLERLRAQAVAAEQIRALADLQARLAASQQAAQANAAELAALNLRSQADADQLRQLQQALLGRETSFGELQARAASLAGLEPAGPETVDELLQQALRLASTALDAEAGLFVLSASGETRLRAAQGAIEAPTRATHALVNAVLHSRRPLLIDELAADPRWTGVQPAPTDPNGSGGDNTRLSPPAATSRYHSALAIALSGASEPLGALLFLSEQPAAFTANHARLAEAAAAQLAQTLQGEAFSAAWHARSATLTRWLSENPSPPAEALNPLLEATRIRQPAVPVAAVEPVLPRTEPLPAAAPIQPASEPETPPAGPNWPRRLAMPALALALAVCALGAIALGAQPLRNALGLGGPASTPTERVAPTAILVSTAANTTAPTAATAAPRNTVVPAPTQTEAVPTATVTDAPTATPAPTDTAAPSPSPTAGLPPGVTALATVTLSEGIAGRLRDAPNGTVVGGVPGNTQVEVLQGRVTTDDGIIWVQIRVPETNQSGWFAESLLSYDTPAP